MSFSVKPYNRRLLIKPELHDKESQAGVLLPEEFVNAERFTTATVLDSSPDCSMDIQWSREIIVQSSMIEEISLRGETHYMILENYVLGMVKKGASK